MIARIFIILMFVSSSALAYEMIEVPGKASKILVVNKASNKISINELRQEDSNFYNPVKILNYPDAQLNSGMTQDYIIFQSDEFNFESTIELVGKPVDIFFVGKTKKPRITCNDCEFIGARRIFLAGKVTVINDKVTSLYSADRVTINGMNSAGIPLLMSVSDETFIDGDISNHQRAIKVSGDNYQVDKYGSLVAGGNGFIFYNGNYKVDYDDLEPELINGSSHIELNPTTNISSTFIKLVSNDPSGLDIKGTFNTKSDIEIVKKINLSLSQHEEGLYVTHLNNYDNKNTDDKVSLNGNYISDGGVYVASNYSVSIEKGSTIVSESAEIFTKSDFYNAGHILSGLVDGAANFISNSGYIQASNVSLASLSNFYNSNGGSIFAENVYLNATGVVLNGNRHPYKLCAKCLTPLSDVVSTTKIVTGKSGLGFLNGLLPSGNERIEWNPVARIYGSNVQIKSRAFENINPYYEFDKNGSWENKITVDNAKENRVVIAAENRLEILSDEYILNSSAVISLQDASSEGGLFFKAKDLVNQRYKTAAYYENKYIEKDGRYIQDLVPLFYYFSPAGKVLSLGQINLEISNSIKNDKSFIETMGRLYVDAKSFSSIGLIASRQNVANEPITIRNCNSDFRRNRIRLEGTNDVECELNRLEEIWRHDQSFGNNEVQISGMDMSTLLYAGNGVTSTADHIIDTDLLMESFYRNLGERVLLQAQRDADKIYCERWPGFDDEIRPLIYDFDSQIKTVKTGYTVYCLNERELNFDDRFQEVSRTISANLTEMAVKHQGEFYDLAQQELSKEL